MTADDDLRRFRERRLDLGRSAGTFACAECQRLKLKCDKKIPCSTCIRRGCTSLCPNKTKPVESKAAFPNRSGNASSIRRMLKEAKLVAMRKRIRILEDALLAEGCTKDDLLSSDFSTSVRADDGVVEQEQDDKPLDIGECGGTLGVTRSNENIFLGSVAVEGALLLNVFKTLSLGNSDDDGISLPHIELQQATRMFPFVPCYLRTPSTYAQLASCLPSYDRALQFIDSYYSLYTRVCYHVTYSELRDELLPTFYPHNAPLRPDLLREEQLHDLALLFSLLSRGALDTKKDDPSAAAEAEVLAHLCRASLGLLSPLEHGSVSACQAIFILAMCLMPKTRYFSHEVAWSMMGMGFNVALSIGLNLDPQRWALDPKLMQRRRRVFWELNVADKWRCLATGRPPIFDTRSIDCRFPDDEVEPASAVVMQVENSAWCWRYRFTRDILSPLATKVCYTPEHAMSYAEVLELDKKLRNFPLHPDITGYKSRHKCSGKSLNLRGFLHPMASLFWKEMAMQKLHRGFFAKLMLENSVSPYQSPYFQSFVSTYHSAVKILGLVREVQKTRVVEVESLHPLWSSSLVSAIIVGAVAGRGSSIGFANVAFTELKKAITSFESASHPIPMNGLKTLYRLRERAEEVAKQTQIHPGVIPTTIFDPGSSGQDFELQLMAGISQLHLEGELSPASSPPLSVNNRSDEFPPFKQFESEARYECRSDADPNYPMKEEEQNAHADLTNHAYTPHPHTQHYQDHYQYPQPTSYSAQTDKRELRFPHDPETVWQNFMEHFNGNGTDGRSQPQQEPMLHKATDQCRVQTYS